MEEAVLETVSESRMSISENGTNPGTNKPVWPIHLVCTSFQSRTEVRGVMEPQPDRRRSGYEEALEPVRGGDDHGKRTPKQFHGEDPHRWPDPTDEQR